MIRVLVVCLLATAHLQSIGQDSTVIVNRLDEYLKSANNTHRFNGVALVVSNGRILFNRAYGYSNMTSKSLNTTETRFPILSITKSMTSTIILKLQEEGRLSVNDKLSKYIPGYPRGSEITIHHLLTHSSGIYDFTLDVGIEDSAIVNYPLTKEKLVNYFKDKPLDFSPGKHYSYNNSGYFLLGLIIEKVTGKPYETVVREYIFNPLGMTDSGFDFINLPQETRAQGYETWNETQTIPYKHYDSSFAYSAGSVYSTSSDMFQWAKAVSAKQILQPATWDMAFKPKINNYGYGWMAGELFGKKLVRHSGGYPGFLSEFIYFPKEDFVIVLLNNFGNYDDNIWATGMGISCILHQLPYDLWKQRKKISVNPAILQKHAGTYAASRKQKIRIYTQTDSLFVEIEGLPGMQLHAESENVYFLKNYNDVLTFSKDKVTIHAHGKDYIYKKKN